MRKIKIATVHELAPGQYKSVAVEGERIALFNIDGKFYALNDVCTHDGDTLTGGTLQGYIIECPRHGRSLTCARGQSCACRPTSV
jgi:3-phenylpropionate/trans-cinnamate dioxygenase ferredoxin subunit